MRNIDLPEKENLSKELGITGGFTENKELHMREVDFDDLKKRFKEVLNGEKKNRKLLFFFTEYMNDLFLFKDVPSDFLKMARYIEEYFKVSNIYGGIIEKENEEYEILIDRERSGEYVFLGKIDDKNKKKDSLKRDVKEDIQRDLDDYMLRDIEKNINYLDNYFPFVLSKIDALTYRSHIMGFKKGVRNKPKEKLYKISEVFAGSEVMYGENKIPKISSIMKELDSLNNSSNINISDFLKNLFPAMKAYSSLNKNYKQIVQRYVLYLVLLDSEIAYSLSPFTLNNEFWEDFIDYSNDKLSNKEKILNSRDFPQFRKWFMEFWSGQKNIPLAVKDVLREIRRQDREKARAEQRKKESIPKTEKLTEDVVVATKEVIEEKIFSAPEVEKISDFLYKIPRKNGFILQMQVGKNLPVDIEEGEFDLEKFAHHKKNVVVKFRYWKKNKQDHEKFSWVEIKLDKKKREKREVGKTNPVQKKVERIVKPPVKQVEKPETPEEKAERERKRLIKELNDNLELFVDSKEEIFAGIPEKIKNDSFNIRFSRDFTELIEQENVEISVNIAEKTLEFRNLIADDKFREILGKYVWEVLKDRIEDWEKRKEELRQTLQEIEKKQAEREKQEEQSKRQEEINTWLLNFDKVVHSAEFFENSEKFAKLLDYVQSSPNTNNLNVRWEVLSKNMLAIATAFKNISNEILKELKSAGIECEIDKSKQVFVKGEIAVTEDKKYEFKASWDRTENKVVLEIDKSVSPNAKKKIQAVFRKIFLKLFWEVLDKSVLRTPFFAGFEEYLKQEEQKKLRRFLIGEKDNGKEGRSDEGSEELKDKKEKFLKKIENGEYLGVDQDGNIVKKEQMKEMEGGILNNPRIKSLILRQDNVRSINEGYESNQRMKFDENSYNKLVEFSEDSPKNEKYLIKRFQITIENYNQYGERFDKYEINQKSPFRNKAIVDLLLDEILPLFDFRDKEGRAEFLNLRPSEIASLIGQKEQSLVEMFLQKAKEKEIPMTYVSDYRVSIEELKRFLEK